MNDKQSEKRRMYRELARFALGQLICLGLMFGVYLLLDKLTDKVLLGGSIGFVLAVVNYLLMAVGVWAAADKAERGDAAGGKRTVTVSMLGRYLLMILVLVAGAKSGKCDVIAMLVPLVLSRPLIFVGEFFRRKEV